MRKTCLTLLIGFAGSVSLLAQTSPPPAPQSARQALIEMFLGKGADDFAKHLPDDARRALIHKGESPETSAILRIASLGHEVGAQGNRITTFDAGPTILVSEQNDGREKIEVTVERDNLIREEDEIELSIHYYKNGELQFIPVLPRVTFIFKEENEIWKLDEITAAAHVPLTDPDYLKGLRKMQDESYESSALMRVNSIAGAETEYVAKHPDRGYACTLNALFAQDSSAAPGTVPQYLDPGLGNDEWNGYRFAFSGCEGSPATKYRLIAVPVDSESTAKTFCADESGKVKFVTNGKSTTCFRHGQPATAEATSTFSVD